MQTRRNDIEALRIRNAELEAQLRATGLTHTESVVESVVESDGEEDHESISPDDTNTLKDAVVALVNSQKTMMEMMRNSRKHKVYVDKPDKFDGKVGDYIETWLEQFGTWFSHREQIEGTVEDRIRVETAIQTTAGDISHQLTRHQADYGRWETWEAFSKHMRDTYGSKEPGFVKYMRLKLTQQNKDSVDIYYSRFHRIFERQKCWMKDPKDNFIYNYMFLEGLNSEVQAEFMRLPDAVDVEDMNLQEVLVLAKRAEQAAKLQSGSFSTVAKSFQKSETNQAQGKSNDKRRRNSKFS